MLYRKRQRMYQTTGPAKIHLDKLQQMRQPDRLYSQANMMDASNYSQCDHQLVDTSLVRKIQFLNSVDYDRIQRKHHTRGQMVSDNDRIYYKPAPALKSPRMTQANQFIKTNKFGSQKMDARMKVQSPSSGGNCNQAQYKRKYRWQKEKRQTFQREKHGLQLLLKLVRQQYDGYRQAAQQMLSDKHEVVEELRDLEEQITSMSRTIYTKNNQIQCYQKQNQTKSQQIVQLKDLLSTKNKQESALLHQLGCSENHELSAQICNKDEQIQLLKNANRETRLILEELSETNQRLALEIEQCTQKNSLQNLEIVADLNKGWEQKVLELQAKIRSKELSQSQFIRLCELEISDLKQQYQTEINNLESDLVLSKQECANLERLGQLLKAQNQGWADKNIHLQKVIVQQYDQRKLFDQLQRKLQEAGESNLEKSETIDALSMTIQKYLSDIEQLTLHHHILTRSLDDHKKTQQEYRSKYEKLQQALGNNIEGLKSNMHVGDDPVIIEMARNYGYQGDIKVSVWIQQQLNQTNDLVQANTKLKRTLNSLNRQIEDKWIKEKIMDMQQIQKLRQMVLRKDQVAQKDSRLLDTIREESKDEHSFDSFIHKLISIKKNLVELTGIKSGDETLLQGEETPTLEDLDKDIQTQIKSVEGYILELVNQIETLQRGVSALTKDTEELQDVNTDLREQVSTMNTFILQKEQFIHKLQKQKAGSKYSHTQTPFEYSLESKRSIQFKFEKDGLFASMDSLQEQRVSIKVGMQQLIGQYMQLDNTSLCPIIQELFVSIYLVNQSKQTLVCFQKFLESVQSYNDVEKKRRSSIKGMVGKLIRQSQELIESDDEQEQEDLILGDY